MDLPADLPVKAGDEHAEPASLPHTTWRNAVEFDWPAHRSHGSSADGEWAKNCQDVAAGIVQGELRVDSDQPASTHAAVSA